MSPNYHRQVLGISEKATTQDITQAYLKMAYRWDPDNHPNDREHATRNFNEVQNAYNALMTSHPHRSHPKTSSSMRHKQEQRHPPRIRPSSSSSLGSGVRVFSSEYPSMDSASDSTPPSTPTQPFGPDRRAMGTRKGHSSSKKHDAGLDVDSEQRFYSSEIPLARVPQTPYMFSNPAAWTSGQQVGSLPKPSGDTHFKRKPHAVKEDARPSLPVQPTPLINDPAINFLGVGPSQEWMYTLTLPLEDLFTGKRCRFRIARHLLSNALKHVVIDIDVPSGCHHGTKVTCRGVGHQRFDGTLEDVVFIIQAAPHDRFSRTGDDLVMNIRLPWIDTLRQQRGQVCLDGINGESSWIDIDYPKERSMKGVTRIKGKGMPIRTGSKVLGRGFLIVQWEITPPRPQNIFQRFLHMRK